jgi:O-antigen ligase
MRPQQLTALLTLAAAVVLALCLGISIATENYALLIFASTLVIVGGLVLMPGHVPLLVFALLVPFSLPVPFVWNFPFLMIGLGICAVKHWMQGGLRLRGLRRNNEEAAHFSTINLPIAFFMAWVFVRYCIKPSLPNVLGWGTDVTGFRAWLSYALAFGVVFYTGRLLAGRAGLLKCMHWLVYVSVLFILVLLPATLSKSQAVAIFFFRLGMFVTSFDNGMLRFVALPEFGLFLLSLLFLPSLVKFSRTNWCILFVLGLAAVILGGNRSSLGMALIIVTVIPLLRHKFMHFAIIAGSAVAISAAVYFAGPTLSQLPHTGFLRALGLVSPELSDVTGGDSNMEWREVRWQRALEEIRQHPLIGVGYGGLENALLTDFQSEEENEDMTLATGGVHNGYIAGTLALGIPAALLFVGILVSQIFLTGTRGFALQTSDPVLADAHVFVCANLLAFAAGMLIGWDLNDRLLWFYIALSVFVRQLRRESLRKPAPVPVFMQPVLAPV